MATITDFINQQNLQNSLNRQLNNQPEYIPTGQGLEIGSFGITPALLRGTGLQMGSMGIDPRLLNYISSPVLTDASLQIGSIGSPYSRRLNTGIPSIYKPETLPALSDLGGITPSFNVANEEDEEQVEYLGSEPTGIAKLFQFISNFSPLGLVRRGLESLRGFNDKIRNTDFGQSKTLVEYLQRREARKDNERLKTVGQRLQEAAERGGGYQKTSQEQNVSRTASRRSDKGLGQGGVYGL